LVPPVTAPVPAGSAPIDPTPVEAVPATGGPTTTGPIPAPGSEPNGPAVPIRFGAVALAVLVGCIVGVLAYLAVIAIAG
jgi:hypothetical protein